MRVLTGRVMNLPGSLLKYFYTTRDLTLEHPDKNFKILVCYFSLAAQPPLQKGLDLVPKKRAQECDSEQSHQQRNQANTSPTKRAVSGLT